MSLADFHAKRFDGRRDYEWKITLGFWGAILAAFATYTKPREVWVWALGITLYVIYAAVWMRVLFYQHNVDKAQTFHYRDAAAIILGGAGVKPSQFDMEKKAAMEKGAPQTPQLPRKGFWNGMRSVCLDWSGSFQLLVTAILMAAFLLGDPGSKH